MTPHSVGRCPKDRGDRSLLGKPFFKRVFLNRSTNSLYVSHRTDKSRGSFNKLCVYDSEAVWWDVYCILFVASEAWSEVLEAVEVV